MSIISVMLVSIVPVINELQGAIESSDAVAQFEDLSEYEAQLAQRGLPGSSSELRLEPVLGKLEWDLKDSGVWFSSSWTEDSEFRLRNAGNFGNEFEISSSGQAMLRLRILAEKYNGWESRDCVYAFERFAKTCYEAFGDRVNHWQVNNEQNLMIRVNERMNMYDVPKEDAERVRAQMDYHMFVAHALATTACHEMIPGSKIGPAVSSTKTYPASNKPMDVWAAEMNDNFKTNYALDMYCYGDYPGYYKEYLEKAGISPIRQPEDEEILKKAKPDLIALNYYRTLVASYLPESEEHPYGTKVNEIDYDLYGYFKIEKNQHLNIIFFCIYLE